MEQYAASKRLDRPLVLPGRESWVVGLSPEARIRDARTRLGPHLGAAEKAAQDRHPDSARRRAQSIASAAESLGVEWVTPSHQGGTGFHLRQAGWTGTATASDAEFLTWTETLIDKHHKTVDRLAATPALRRHLVLVARYFTSMGVQFLLEDTRRVPQTEPSVPAELTDVWVVGAIRGQGAVCWSRDVGWSRVSERAIEAAWAAADERDLGESFTAADGYGDTVRTDKGAR